MVVDLGFQPIDIAITLATDADFITKLVAEDGWPVGTRIQLRFVTKTTPVVWEATITGTDAVFDIPAEDVSDLIADGPVSVRLHYLDGSGDDLLWGRGRVHIV